MVNQIQTRYVAQWINAVSDIPQDDWDALALPLTTPFFEWEWLHNLEESGSATAKSGWLPNHLVLWREDDSAPSGTAAPEARRRLVAIAPLYLKGHSYGEFVFDYQWADLAERLGVRYYPKLLGMSPVTPAEGYRFLIAPDEDEDELTAMMVQVIDQFCLENGISGCNFLYVDQEWRSRMEKLGFMSWLHHSFVWRNRGFQDFDGYLGSFNANQRRNIKRERKAVTTAGLTLRPVTGDEISTDLLLQMYDFYCDTCDKFGWWGSKYLSRQFFEQLQPAFCHRTVLFAAYDDASSQRPIGMSMCFTKGDRLYGRYWGSTNDIENLHFDACYYSPVGWAIAQGIQIFDPGAGGRHKKRRGFPATPNHSLHRFYDPRLAKILRNYIGEINAQEQQEIDDINQDLPFKHAD